MYAQVREIKLWLSHQDIVRWMGVTGPGTQGEMEREELARTIAFLTDFPQTGKKYNFMRNVGVQLAQKEVQVDPVYWKCSVARPEVVL